MGVFYSVVTLLVTLFISSNTFARPEYAARNKMQCTLCHFSPVGGSLRNVTGKAFGFRGFSPGKWAQQDTVSLDVRGMYRQPEKTKSKGGLQIMAGVVGAALPLQSSDDGKETTLVISHNIAGNPMSNRMDTFIRWKNYHDGEQRLMPQYITLGRFHSPFGVITEEHFTYTKMQSATSWLNLESGLMFSSEINSNWHYDLALVNGNNKNGGASFAAEGAQMWGGVANVRWMPESFAAIFGGSFASHARGSGKTNAQAASIYTIVPTDFLFNGSITLEYVEAKYWNLSLAPIVKDISSYLPSVSAETSAGRLVQFNYNLNDKWTITYKYDWLALNKEVPADAYIRHGLGFKHYIGPNMFVLGRLEEAIAQRPGESSDNPSYGADSAGFLMLNISI